MKSETGIGHVEIGYCGHVDSESRETAFDIANAANTEDEFWCEVDKLDSATREAIHEHFSVIEVVSD